MLSQLFKILLLVLFIGVTSDAEAGHRPRGRTVAGIVEAIESTTQMITVVVNDNGVKERLELHWSSRTKASRDGKPAAFESLKIGIPVRARYIRPLFGPPVLRQIIWCDSELSNVAPDNCQG